MLGAPQRSGHDGPVKPVPEASTDPLRAWRSGNRWFLAACRVGAGKERCLGAGQRTCAENGVGAGGKWRQGHGVAGLAGCAGVAVGRARMGWIFAGRTASAVVNSLRLVKRLGFCGFMTNMHLRAWRMGMGRDCLCRRWQGLQRRQRHPGRHGFAHPAAQQQQGDHEDEGKATHYLMISDGGKGSRRPFAFSRCRAMKSERLRGAAAQAAGKLCNTHTPAGGALRHTEQVLFH